MQPSIEAEALSVISEVQSTSQFLYLAPLSLLTTGPPRGEIRYLPDWPSPGGALGSD